MTSTPRSASWAPALRLHAMLNASRVGWRIFFMVLAPDDAFLCPASAQGVEVSVLEVIVESYAEVGARTLGLGEVAHIGGCQPADAAPARILFVEQVEQADPQ